MKKPKRPRKGPKEQILDIESIDGMTLQEVINLVPEGVTLGSVRLYGPGHEFGEVSCLAISYALSDEIREELYNKELEEYERALSAWKKYRKLELLRQIEELDNESD